MLRHQNIRDVSTWDRMCVNLINGEVMQERSRNEASHWSTLDKAKVLLYLPCQGHDEVFGQRQKMGWLAELPFVYVHAPRLQSGGARTIPREI